MDKVEAVVGWKCEYVVVVVVIGEGRRWLEVVRGGGGGR